MSNNPTNTARVITVRLRVPALALLAILLTGVLVWAFVLGIMVGRGQINDELAALMPEQQRSAPSEVDKAADEVEKLIKAEDLKYQESLRQDQPQAPVRAAADPTSLADAVRHDLAPTQKPDRVYPGSASYRYSYQVASYNKEEQAGELAAKLLAKGIMAEVEARTVDGVSRFRVLISFDGDEKSVESIQNMLKNDFKISSILQRSKTPLGT